MLYYITRRSTPMISHDTQSQSQHPTLQYYWWFLLHLLWMRIKIFFNLKKKILKQKIATIYMQSFSFLALLYQRQRWSVGIVCGNRCRDTLSLNWYFSRQTRRPALTDWSADPWPRSPSAYSCWAPWSRFLSTRLSFPGWSLGYPWQTRSAPWPSRFSPWRSFRQYDAQASGNPDTAGWPSSPWLRVDRKWRDACSVVGSHGVSLPPGNQRHTTTMERITASSLEETTINFLEITILFQC